MRRTRAERRHHHRRMKNKVKKYDIVTQWPSEYTEDRASRYAETRKPCSCDMCRNPRHSGFYKGEGKLTMCEKRIKQIDIYEDYD